MSKKVILFFNFYTLLFFFVIKIKTAVYVGSIPNLGFNG